MVNRFVAGSRTFNYIQVNIGLWYGVVRDWKLLSYQVTPTFYTSHIRSKTDETRMNYTM